MDDFEPKRLTESKARTPFSFKRPLLGALFAINLALVLALLTAGGVLPTASAQAGARGGSFLCVTAKPAGQSCDVLYVLDQASQKLHAYYPAQPQTRQLIHTDARDVKKDFGN